MAPGDIENLIRKEGPIPVERFMRLAIKAYYAQGTAFGRSGDFTTAPEISQVFGELTGAWCFLMWETMGRPDAFHLVELGPGRATLMADLLRASSVMPGFLPAMQLHLVETSPSLRAQQAAALSSFAPLWHDTVQTLPQDGPVLIVANEFLDALPIRQYVKVSDGWHERLVGLNDQGRLGFMTAKQTSAHPPLSAMLDAAPIGSVAEANPQALALVDDLAQRLKRTGGAALFIDYGPLESGPGDSLQAVKGHTFAPVLDEAGNVDLTAHVDFAALARQARAQGLHAWGPVPQGVWLQRLGILERTKKLAATAKPEQRDLVVSGTRRLIDPQEMGTLFKVLALTPSAYSFPPGFEVT